MKIFNRLLILLILAVPVTTGYTQSSTQNYIQTTSMTSTSGGGVVRIDYYDGLGRPVERVHKNAGPSSQDWIYLTDYDAYDRVEKEWLPAVVAGNNGVFLSPASVRTSSGTSNAGDPKAYSLTVYEASPLSRPISRFGPGNDWHYANKAVHTSYLSNSSSYPCTRFTSTDTRQTITITRSDVYDAGELFVTKMQDEDDRVSYEFRDKLGRKILTRQVNGTTNFDTYYVYDNYGNLRVVLPPLATDALGSNTTYSESNTALQQYGYLYKYDDRNRCTAKKLPGADWINYVYDNADRVIFTQDGVLRDKGKWQFTIPDAFDRTVLSGTCTNSTPSLGGVVVKATWSNTTNSNKGYTVSGVTLSGMDLQTVFYYDQYDFISKNSVPSGMGKVDKAGYPSSITDPRGLLTGAVFQQLGSSACLYEAYYYDVRSRQVQTRRTNHLGGTDLEYVSYTFDGLPEKRYHEQLVSGTTRTEEYAYTYDAGRRLTKTTHNLNNGGVKTLSDKTYDALGRLLTDKKGALDNLKATYGYDVRSRCTTQSENQYSQTLSYSRGSNIQTQTYTQNGMTQSYSYTYDGLSRMTNAGYSVSNRDCSVSYAYDKQGNPTSLIRKGQVSANSYGTIDNLTFTYNGNQLKSVNDGASNIPYSFSHDFKNYSNLSTEYSYDKNGNLTSDFNRGISSITYNLLNLPDRTDIKSPVGEARNEYVYRSDGTKLRVVHKWNPNYSTAPVIGSSVSESSLTKTETMDYVGNFVYVDNQLKRILTENGYIENGQYYYNVTDHLGNIRILADASGVKKQSTVYYPYGLQTGESTGSEVQPYKYSGKEYDQLHGLNLYDFSARFYDPSLGRFMTMDPLAEKYYGWSPYAYCANNPLRFVDPDGMDWFENGSGDVIWRKSRDQEYEDENGNSWKNIGTEYLFVSGNKATLFRQEADESGELYLKSSTFSVTDERTSR